MPQYEVRHHRGRSGRSVFEWRVYALYQFSPTRTVRKQLAKYRTRECAENAAAFYRAKAEGR